MNYDLIKLNGMSMEVYSLNTVIVGSGAAGLNAADRLYTYGQKDIAIVTEGMKMGTSRNTGSDKQTYYKLTLAGNRQDSVMDMANTLFKGGCMDGDIALVEAAMSAHAFYHLVDIGVPFPHNRYGEYVGYKTDHDPAQRATSAGPLTSRYMTEKLEEQVRSKGIRVFDGYQVVGILTSEECDSTLYDSRAIGVIALNLNALEDADKRFVLFNCTNIVYAVGGPAGIYYTSVYPESQTGASGIAFEAGIKGKNLTESQYGLASIKFRWNLSGTYQQVLPRYVSTNQNGTDEKEFLTEYFESPGKMLDAIFFKGYQWPFDPRRITNYGSSFIDILVYNETVIKGRRVFLDFTKNTEWGSCKGELDFSLLGDESYTYLKKSNALFGTPIERLKYMNKPAVDLYISKGIDLSKDKLEIAVCAQHNNGGLCGNIWWESNVKHFFPVGEVNGSHGVYRPGGTALNSGQVGSTRAAQYIAARYSNEPMKLDKFLRKSYDRINEIVEMGKKFLCSQSQGSESNVFEIRKEFTKKMSEAGASIRNLELVERCIKYVSILMNSLIERTVIKDVYELPHAYKNWDLLTTQFVYLNSIADYIRNGGRSRGSFLVYDRNGTLPFSGLPEVFRYKMDDGKLANQIQEVKYVNGKCKFSWRSVRSIPMKDDWFEDIWKQYINNNIYG